MSGKNATTALCRTDLLLRYLLERPVVGVDPDVLLERSRVRGGVVADLAFERLVAGMDPGVVLQLVLPRKSLPAVVAAKRFLAW